MKRIKYRKVRKVQTPQPEYTGTYKEIPTDIQLFVYDSQNVAEYQQVEVDKLDTLFRNDKVNWLNIHGLNDVEKVQAIVEKMGVEGYVVSDILNTTRRTRIEEYDDVVFFSIKSILSHHETEAIVVEQISFLLKGTVLISFQEKKGDFFTHIRERLRTDTGMARKKKADYLLYNLLDAVMENFYLTIESKEDLIERLLILSKTTVDPKVLESIENERENFNYLKRSIIPLREALFTLKTVGDQDDFKGIDRTNLIYFTRLYQKSLELLDQVDYDMNSLESASNFFFSSQSHRMNEIMKTLTIIASIFIPLTFIAGIYGMNFENMPELEFKNAYFITLGVMFIITLLMLIYFKYRKWF